MREIERRFTKRATELRAGSQSTITGYGAVFNRESSNLGGFVEIVAERSFNKSQGDGWPDVMARYNHDDNMLLGTTAAGTLRLSIDSEGLRYEVDVPQSRADVLELVARGDITKSSFAFRAMEDDWSLTENGFPVRTLTKVQLVDVAPVNVPAYPDTSAGLRSLAERCDAGLDEVRALANSNELRKLLVRTDQQVNPASVQQKLADLMGRRYSPYSK